MYDIIAILLLAAAAVFAVPPRAKAWFTLAIVVAATVAAGLGATGLIAVSADGTAAVDQLSTLFLSIIAVAGISSVVYSHGYIRSAYRDRPSAHLSVHYFSLVALILSMMMVVICRDGARFLFWWELMTLSSFMLIVFEPEKPQVRRAALTYLVMMHAGFVMLLWGFARIHAAGLPMSFDSLGAYFEGGAGMPLFVIFLIGFGMKAGLFPLHSWLPEAHPAAPAHVSGVMSGVMIKMGVYGILRVAASTGEWMWSAGLVLFIVGAVTGVWGVLSAAMQNDMKRLLAYSSIENVGIITMAAGLAFCARAGHNDMLALCAMSGALLHTVNHAMFKPMLFFGAGSVYTQTHTTSLDALGGVARKMPFTAGLFLLATLAICAMPPLGGFVSEFMMFFGMFEGMASGRDVLLSVCGLIVLAVIGGAVALAFTKLYGVVFLGEPRSDKVDCARETDMTRIAASLLPAAAVIAVGLFAPLSVGMVFPVGGDLLGIGGASARLAAISGDIAGVSRAFAVLIAVVAAVAAARGWALRRRRVSQSPTWGCGFTAPSARMQYTGESFSEGLGSIASGLTGSQTRGGTVPKSEIFPGSRSFSVGHKDRVEKLFSAWWVEFIRVVNRRVMRMRTGRVNHYILYALGFLAFILILSVLHFI